MVSSRIAIKSLGMSAMLLGCALPSTRPMTAARPDSPNAIVDWRHAGPDGAVDGSTRTYRTLGAALAAGAPDTSRYTILIRIGRYREKLSVDRPNVSLIGESREDVIITYDAASDTRRPEGGVYGTRGSFTLRVTAPGFSAERLTIENAFDYMANAAKAADDPTKFLNPQAVALMTDGASDAAVFVNVRIVGHQDTLFVNAGRHYFAGCTILGSVDFIFGAGQAVFEDCDIVSRDRGSRTNNGYVTAPSTPLTQPYGFLFIRSRLKKESPTMAPNTVVLGRPWHPAALPGVNSAAAYIDCWMDDHIGAKGWDRMSAVDSATTTRIWFEPGDSRFFEYRSSGPGGGSSPGRRTLTAAEAEYYTPINVLRGWRPIH